jgi:O-antigen/teichoic acid export membrane protein
LRLRRLLPWSGDATLLTGARIVAYAIGTVTPIVLARRLDVDDMGAYRDVLLLGFTGMQVLQLGLPQSLFYFLPSQLERRWTAVTHSLIVLSALGAVVVLASLASGPALAAVFREPELAGLAAAVGVYVAAMVVTTLLDALPIADGRVRVASAFALGTEVFRSALLLGAAVLAPTLRGLMAALVAAAAVRVIALWWTARPYLARRPWVDGSMARAQWAFSAPFALSLVLATAAATIDKYLVSFVFGPTVFAVYVLGLTTVPLVDILFNTQSEVVMSTMKTSRDRGDREAIRLQWVEIVRRMGLFVIPVFALLLVIGADLIVALYGERYAESAVIFTVFVFHLLRYIAPYGVLPRVFGETVFILRVSGLALVATAIVLVVSIAVWGYVGAAVAYVISLYLVSWPQVLKGWRLLGVSARRFLPWQSLTRVGLCSAVAAGAILALRSAFASPEWVYLAGATVTFAAVYLGALFLSGELTSRA